MKPSLLSPSLAALILLCTLGGCARVKRLVQADPAGPAPQRTVALRLHAAKALNTDSRGQPLALVARIYQLRHGAAFEQARFDSFMHPAMEREALGADLVDVREVVLVPGQHYEVRDVLGPGVGYIGIVALFHSPAPQRWRLAFAAAPAQHSGITVGVHGCSLLAGAGAAPLTAPTVGPAQCR